jgi:hypothetical protein
MMKRDVAQRLGSGRETKKNENDSLCAGYTLSGFDGGKMEEASITDHSAVRVMLGVRDLEWLLRDAGENH